VGGDVRLRVRRFLDESFGASVEVDKLADDESLQQSGVIDSFGVLSLITFIESEFAVHVSDAEVVPENLDSVSRIVAYIEGKRQ
jgi:acyl carrier protein